MYNIPPLLDIDECATDGDNCDMNSTCVNTAGGFICTCIQGSGTDGSTCSGKEMTL